MPAAEPNFAERAGSSLFVWGSLCTDPPNDPQPCNPGECPVHIRTPNRTPETNTKSVRDDSSTVSGTPKIIAPAPAVQRATRQGAEGCAGRRSAPSPLAGL
jgi:hypothetical protein